MGVGAAGVHGGAGRDVQGGEQVQHRAGLPHAAVLGGHPQAVDAEGAGRTGGAEVAEAEGGGDVGARRRQLVRQALQRGAADAAADEQRVGDAVRGERAAERAGDVDRVADVEPREPLAARRRAPRRAG